MSNSHRSRQSRKMAPCVVCSRSAAVSDCHCTSFTSPPTPSEIHFSPMSSNSPPSASAAWRSISETLAFHHHSNFSSSSASMSKSDASSPESFPNTKRIRHCDRSSSNVSKAP